ncbi:MAG: acireductone synthase [Acidobacteriota bacterium]
MAVLRIPEEERTVREPEEIARRLKVCWTPHYTESGVEASFPPVCEGSEDAWKAKSAAIILDVEGVTTPVSFVHDVLFPYARARVEAFLRRQSKEEDVRRALEELKDQYLKDREDGLQPPPWPQAVRSRASRPSTSSPDGLPACAYILWLMDHDRKTTGLKRLQGRIWEQGYKAGELRGQVYPDVPICLKTWRDQGLKVCIFSSGSILAQKLLFRHSDGGDLEPYITAHFDTTTGPKREAASYRSMAGSLGLPPASILFISDTVEELEAARKAGLKTCLCIRETARPPAGSEHRVIRSLEAARL